MNAKYKLISSHDADMFQDRLNKFLLQLGQNVAIADTAFSTCTLPDGKVMYSALVQYKQVENWE